MCFLLLVYLKETLEGQAGPSLLAIPQLVWGTNLQLGNSTERAGAGGVGLRDAAAVKAAESVLSMLLTIIPYAIQSHSPQQGPVKAAFFLMYFSLKDDIRDDECQTLHFSASCGHNCTWMVLPSHLLQHKQPQFLCKNIGVGVVREQLGSCQRLTHITSKEKKGYCCWDSQGLEQGQKSSQAADSSRLQQ